jgi:CubicO group peptidase (beta-lactamase class C family)
MSTSTGKRRGKFNTERLQRINQFMESYVDQGKSAGMLALVYHNDEIVHQHITGYRDIASSSPIEPDTIFRIYSLTKPITSVALMMLLEKGHFQIDDRADRWIPALKNLKVYDKSGKYHDLERPITIRNLLTHTAGFSYGFYPEDNPVDKLYQQAWEETKYEKTLCQMVDTMLSLPLYAQPGRLWHYSIATDLCGYLVELMSNMPLSDYFNKHLFDPLGMKDTGFIVPRENLNRFSTLYGLTENDPLGVIETDENSPYYSLNDEKKLRLESGGGGLVSTAPDYLQFARMMLNKGVLNGTRILGRKTVEWMTQNHLEPSHLPMNYNGIVPQNLACYGFGLGYCINMDGARAGTLGSTGDYGWGSLADSYCWIDPAENLIGLLMQQFVPSQHHAGRRDFRNAVYQALD